MEFEGRVWKSAKGKYWVSYIELLDLSTQGTSKANALAMTQDAIEALVHRKGFNVCVAEGKNGAFTIGANQAPAWMGFFLQRLRMKAGLTMEAVALRMGSSSKTAYARYEHGIVVPSLEKFTQILHAISPDRKPVLRLAA